MSKTQSWGVVLSVLGGFMFFAAPSGFTTAAEIKFMTSGVGLSQAQIDSVLQQSGYSGFVWGSSVLMTTSFMLLWFGIKKFTSGK